VQFECDKKTRSSLQNGVNTAQIISAGSHLHHGLKKMWHKNPYRIRNQLVATIISNQSSNFRENMFTNVKLKCYQTENLTNKQGQMHQRVLQQE